MRRRCLLPLLLAVACSAIGQQPSSGFRFAILGDRTGSAVPAVYEQTWREIDHMKPDFVINVGDTIQGRRDETAEAEWKTLRPLFQRYRRYPLYFVAGNHDIWSAISRKVFEQQTGRPATYSFSRGNAHFIVLDNSQTGDLSLEQLQFLEGDLKANRDKDPKFVFFHQPFWITFLKFQSGAFPLHRLAREYNVRFVVSGHTHFLLKMEREGVTYLQMGSSGARIQPDFDKGVFYQFGWVEVKGRDVRITVKELGPPYGQSRSVAIYP